MKSKNMKSKKKEAAISVVNIAEIGSEVKMDINKDDLITVMVAEKEEELKNKRKELQNQFNAIEKEIDDIDKQIRTECIAAAEIKYRATLDKYVTAFSELYGVKTKKKGSINAELNYNESKSNIHVSVGLPVEMRDVDIEMWPPMMFSGRRNLPGMQVPEIQMTQKLKRLVSKRTKLRDKRQKLNDEMQEIREELYNLDSNERQFKAKVIKKFLANAGDKGKKLLELTEE